MTETVSDKDIDQLLADIQHGSLLDINKLWAALIELKDRRAHDKITT